MECIENKKIDEKVYIEKLENGLKVIIIPKRNTQKKYIIWATKYGSNDNVFIVEGDNKETRVPNGVAHYLEHKLFEQENGKNSLDVLTSLGVNANAFTTNEYTAYLFETTKNFYKALDEFMDYVQNPYFTDENVEKERGIISQEIRMYDDSPNWKVYLNCMEAMYYKNPIKIDIAGTVESIKKIDKDILYKCYNAFYQPNNMILVVSGDFIPENILKEIKSRIVKKDKPKSVERIFEKEDEKIVKHEITQKFDISQPIFTIGIKDTKELKQTELIKRQLAVEIILNTLLGKSSRAYTKLYESGLTRELLDMSYEFGRNYAHVLISGQSDKPNELFKKIKEEIRKAKKEGIEKKSFERSRKKIYGEYIREFDQVDDIAKMFLVDSLKEINSFDYFDEINNIDVEYTNKILREIFKEDKMVISIIKK